jgi:hypothetical protein
MPVGTLFRVGVRRFLEAEQDTGNDLWVFLHIPKTAGSSLGTEMARILQPSQNIEVDYKDPSKPFLDKLDDAVSSFIEASGKQRHRLAFGHIRANHVERIKVECASVKVVTMLRHPMKRIVSDYYYQRTPRHPLHAEFQRSFPTLASYVEDPISQNIMWQHLALPTDTSPAPVIARMEETYAFVGSQATYPMSFRLIMRLLGQNVEPTVHERKAEAGGEAAEKNDPAVARRILALNGKDMAIYEHFATRLAAVRQDVWKELT